MSGPHGRRRCQCWILSALILGVLSGCSSVLQAGSADVAGVAGAGLATAITRNAAVATGIGLGIAAGANAGLQYAERRVHRTEQDQIAASAGGLAPGVVGHWSVTHSFPIEANEHGDLVVVRELGNDAFICREILFSVEDGTKEKPTRAFYTAAVCEDGGIWKWATAEPATERWGALQ